MEPLPATWTALCLLAFGLGVKHGFDADHLATVDGLTRCNARTNPALARLAGALFVAGLFVIGMLLMDGINGVWINRLIRRADRTAAVASRVMALSVAGISLAVGLFTLAKLFLPAVDAWADGRELAFGAAVMVGVAIASAVGMGAARRPAPAVGGD